MPEQVSGDPTLVWAYGINEPGWYCAMWGWRKWYADHLESMGYRVVRSIGRPTPDGRPTNIHGQPDDMTKYFTAAKPVVA
jgi:hypothetical protein